MRPMNRMEEMEGVPQTGLSLARTIDSIVSVVRQSRGEPAPTPQQKAVTTQEMMTIFRDDLQPKGPPTESETQERIDLDSLRRALHGA